MEKPITLRINISIHTPARGATCCHSLNIYRFNISIHTPTRGATVYSRVYRAAILDFNPHSREESDVPPWIFPGADPVNFNPHSRKGSDNKGLTAIFFAIYFNPHSREGSDLLNILLIRIPHYFNPHSREGSDCAARWEEVPCSIFQSTLPRGERHCKV